MVTRHSCYWGWGADPKAFRVSLPAGLRAASATLGGAMAPAMTSSATLYVLDVLVLVLVMATDGAGPV